jgi:hypothetical protein
LRTYRDEDGRELFDVEGAPLPDPDTPAPVRFLPTYDNVLLGHEDRRRIAGDVPLTATLWNTGETLGSFLVDGLVRGSWKVRRQDGGATMTIRTLGALAPDDESDVRSEAAALAAFVAGPGTTLELEVVQPGG